ncbi:MAG TPA: ATP-binding protein, partial [Gemmatimonadaceae bacterium]|nr:ATP-binding protein [Gemmatimonadaceae bacterium]
QRGGALTAQLVATARRKRLAMEAVDLNEVVRTTLDLFQRALDERVHVVQRLDARGAPARLNWSQAEQVVMNLLLNARDAVALRGGTITVSTMRRHARTTLRVDDDGVGMSEAVRRRVFERFFTTKETAGGTGLGLATVHAVVARAGGRVLVESAPGAGASFGVELPAPESMAAAG